MERYKVNPVFMIVGGVFSAAAVIFIAVIAVTAADVSEFRKNADEVTAVITEIEAYRRGSGSDRRTYHDVYISYEYDGEEYSGTLSYYTSDMYVGDMVEIYVDSECPWEIRSDSAVLYIVFGIMAVVFGAVGGVLIGIEARRAVYVNRLITDNMYIYAQYAGEQPSNTYVNHVRYMCSVFEYCDPFGHRQIFLSSPHHPSKCGYCMGDSEIVYVDIEKNPSKYYVSQGNRNI